MYRNIVVGTDGSDRASIAVEHAASLAAATGAIMHLVQGCGSAIRVAPLHGDVMPIDQRAIVAACTEELETLAEGIRSDHGVTVGIHVHTLEAADALAAAADEVSADLIVCGNRRVSGMSRVLGSVAKAMLGRASCAVLVVDTS